MRQLGRAVEYQHIAAGFQRVDCIARALHQQNVTGAQPDRIEVAGDLGARRSRTMDCEGQQSVTGAESRRRERAQVKR